MIIGWTLSTVLGMCFWSWVIGFMCAILLVIVVSRKSRRKK